MAAKRQRMKATKGKKTKIEAARGKGKVPPGELKKRLGLRDASTVSRRAAPKKLPVPPGTTVRPRAPIGGMTNPVQPPADGPTPPPASSKVGVVRGRGKTLPVQPPADSPGTGAGVPGGALGGKPVPTRPGAPAPRRRSPIGAKTKPVIDPRLIK